MSRKVLAGLSHRIWWGLAFLLVAGMIIGQLSGLRAHAGGATQDGWLWQVQAPTELREARAVWPRNYGVWRLNRQMLEDTLRRAPREFSAEAKTAPLILPLPLPDGTTQRFTVTNSPVMEAELAARFPEIQTYTAQGVDDATVTARFSLTPQGFHAIILAQKGTFYVEPVKSGDTENHLAYAHADLPQDGHFACASGTEEARAGKLRDTAQRPNVGETLRVYRLAVAATAEYTQAYGGGSVNGGLAAVVTTVNLVNAIYERDVSVRLMLIARENELIFTDTTTDGYTSDNVSALFSENQTRLDTILGPNGYDIGHVLDGRLLGGGSFSYLGLGSIGAVCRDGVKARGVSIVRSLQPSNVTTYFHVAHEMGHQFGANHTLNATTGDCGSQRTASSAYEPATGSTVMGYRFNCGAEDIGSTTNSTYFHLRSILQITDYITNGPGGSCPTLITTGNRAPAINAGADYTIPANTPFLLSGGGTDPDGAALTYNWEQYDLGNPSPPSTDDGTRPIFRSFDPTANPARIFPRLSNILSGTTTLGESLPTTTRTMHFRLTARDNQTGGGGVNFDEMLLTSRADAGPFTVTQPAAGVNLTGGTAQTVVWNVANTEAAPINTARVRITFSTDGGATFPHILQESTSNDGTEAVIIPNLSAGSARVKVEAVGNVFFNLSPAFSVTAGAGAVAMLQLMETTAVAPEDANVLSVTVNRTGDTSRAVSVNYATADGTAQQRGDYTVTNGTLNFSAGETSKIISVPLVNDAYPEASENFTLTLSSPSGAVLNGPTVATLTISDNDASANVANPLETEPFFVRQHYYDFLSRTPDADGLNYWTGQITGCGADTNCVRARRIGVSAAFFIEQEFQDTGSFVYRFYKASYGTLPTYAQFTPDRAQVVGGTQLEISRQAFANQWVQRPEFLARYSSGLTSAQFVDALLATVLSGSGVNLSAQRNSLLTYLNSGGTRAGVVRLVADNPLFQQAEYNRAFVLMQYFGYLRRDPDTAGYDFWLDVVTNREPGTYRGMVCAFITAAEYQQRFGQQTPRSNAECVPGI